jgi:hypothetical protein
MILIPFVKNPVWWIENYPKDIQQEYFKTHHSFFVSLQHKNNCPMPNPTTKQELLAAMADGYVQLNEQIAKMSEDELTAPFSFTADPKKCGVRWQNDRCLRDLLIHLYEWQVLMSTFVKNIREGHPKDYLPDEYRKNYHEMDKMIVEKHQSTSLEEAKTLLQRSHEEMLRLAESFSEEELFTKGYYKNTYTTSMAAYYLSVTSYGQAVKILKTHRKSLKKK